MKTLSLINVRCIYSQVKLTKALCWSFMILFFLRGGVIELLIYCRMGSVCKAGDMPYMEVCGHGTHPGGLSHFKQSPAYLPGDSTLKNIQ